MAYRPKIRTPSRKQVSATSLASHLSSMPHAGVVARLRTVHAKFQGEGRAGAGSFLPEVSVRALDRALLSFLAEIRLAEPRASGGPGGISSTPRVPSLATKESGRKTREQYEMDLQSNIKARNRERDATRLQRRYRDGD